MTDWPPERLKKLGQSPHQMEAELAAQEEARRRIEELLSRERAIKACDDLTEAMDDLTDMLRGFTRELENLRNEDREDWQGPAEA